MRSLCRTLFLSVVATGFAGSVQPAAQTVCEGFSTVLNAMNYPSKRRQLEFYTLPGATCGLYERRTYFCEWSMSGPGLDSLTSRSQLDEWERNVSNEIKKLAGAFQRCINEGQVPYKWSYFDKTTGRGRIDGYYIDTAKFPPISVELCVQELDYSLPVGRQREGAKLRLTVTRNRKAGVCSKM